MKQCFFLALSAVLAVALAACGGPGDEVEITETVKRSEHRPPVDTKASSGERFGVSAPRSSASQEATFHWTTPEGWDTRPSTQYRLANFVFGPNGEGECYLSVLSGGGGGVPANANRWRGQLGLADYTQEEFGQLARKTVLGQEAVYVEFDGLFTGMGEADAQEDYRLMGVLLVYEGQGIYVKMVGPAELLEGEGANFDVFLDSLHEAVGHQHEGAGETEVAEADGLPAGHPDVGGASLPDLPASIKSPDYTWRAPEGWNQGPDRAMRLVSFTLGESGGTECYVTILGGDGGGTVMNLNRWQSQMGQDPLSDEEIDGLPKIVVLGEPVPLLEVKGSFQGMTGDAKSSQTLLGVARMLEDTSVFVKMTGPEEEVLARKESFVAFCESLAST